MTSAGASSVKSSSRSMWAMVTMALPHV